MIKLRFLSNRSDEWDFFSWSESVRNTFNIKNKSDTSKDPFLWWKFGLQLGSEHVSITSVLGLVAWALVNVCVNFLNASWNDLSSAVNDWHNGELFLWSRLLKLTDSSIPSSSFNLESEDVSSLFAWWKICLPIQLFENICLDGKLVQFLFLLSGVDLLNGSQE